MTTSPPNRPTARSTFRSGADSHWVWSVAERSPDQAAQRLVEHDALHLQAFTALRVRERFLLVDSERAFRRACVLVGIRASAMRGDPPPEEQLAAWFEACIDDAADDCLTADELALRDGLPCAEDLAHYEFFHQACMVPTENTLFVSVQYHRLPADCREVFFALFIDHCEVPEALERGLGPRDRLRERAQRALDAAIGIDPPAPGWREAADDTIGPWWAQPDPIDGAPEDQP